MSSTSRLLELLKAIDDMYVVGAPKGKFEKGDNVVIGRQIKALEAFDHMPESYLDVLKRVIALRPDAEIAYEAGDVGLVISSKIDGKYSVGVVGKPAAFVPEADLSIAPDDTTGYPEGFVSGAKVVANRDITMTDIYGGKVPQDQIDTVEELQFNAVGRKEVFLAGETGTIRNLQNELTGQIVVVVPDVANMGPSGHPVQAAWFNLA